MKRIRDFAEECSCTPQNIYKHLKNYEEELKDHVHKGRRGLMLDEHACDFLRDVMYPKEVSADNELQQELAKMRSMYFNVLAERQQLQDKVSTLESENKQLQSDAATQKRLLLESQEEKNNLQSSLEQAETELEEARSELKSSKDELLASQSENESLEKELATFEKTWFGLYRKKG